MKHLKLFLMLGIFSLLSVSCEELGTNGITLKKDSVILMHGQTYQIQATSSTPLTYESKNDFHAVVDETGLVKAMFVGETTILISNGIDTKSFRVNVLPEQHLYREPENFNGATLSDLISMYGQPSDNDGKMVRYDNWPGAKFCAFSIKNGRTESAGVFIDTRYTSALADFLGERYLYVGKTGDAMVFIDGISKETHDTYISVQVMNVDLILVMYISKNNLSKVTGLDQQATSKFLYIFDSLE